MTDPNACAQIMGTKEILEDALMSQKHITEGYNTFAGECVNEQLRTAFLNILDDEHCIQADVFGTMQSNGWYAVESAQPQKIQQARQKFSRQP